VNDNRDDASERTHHTRRASFILSIWPEAQRAAPDCWRGYLETTTGQRAYFDSLDTLNRFLTERAGWREA